MGKYLPTGPELATSCTPRFPSRPPRHTHQQATAPPQQNPGSALCRAWDAGGEPARGKQSCTCAEAPDGSWGETSEAAITRPPACSRRTFQMGPEALLLRCQLLPQLRQLQREGLALPGPPANLLDAHLRPLTTPQYPGFPASRV